MKISHCIMSIDKSTGGPARSATYLVKQLAKIEKISNINLYVIESTNPLIKKSSSLKMKLDFSKSNILNYSKVLNKKLKDNDTQLFHGHGIWDLPIHQMSKIALKRKIPYVISIRGALEPWCLRQSKLKKNIAMLLYQYNDLRKSTCLHATADKEVKSIRALGFKNPIAKIPNGINIEEFPLKNYNVSQIRKRKIVFLSRVHHQKGIVNLILAWKSISIKIKNNWTVEIAGNGEEKFLNQLNDLILKNGLNNEISIVGYKSGKEKINFYHSADVFVLPTYSENFGIVIAEALCCGVPVITTTGSPWSDINKYKLGRWIEIGEEPLKKALIELMSKSDEERFLMGKNGRDFIVLNYSIEATCSKMMRLYDWIINDGPIPNFIDL